MPNWNNNEIRRHLSNFLFCQNEEINSLVKNLSGGEKARLTLAQIAAKNPNILLLDEITNNLDLESKNYVSEVLKSYNGTIIFISHDDEFVDSIRVNRSIDIESFK